MSVFQIWSVIHINSKSEIASEIIKYPEKKKESISYIMSFMNTF